MSWVQLGIPLELKRQEVIKQALGPKCGVDVVWVMVFFPSIGIQRLID